jgi:ParB family transcriptional regulator, chromosome partitioning protein
MSQLAPPVDAFPDQCVDLHRLQLRFADTRVCEPRAIDALARSIEQCGQRVPCIVICEAVSPEDSGSPRALSGLEHWVLIDGYRRVAALRRAGQDTAQVERWNCDLTHALLRVLAVHSGRSFAPIEQALLLRELQSLGLSQHELARRSGRDVSWVSRRLALLCELPDQLLQAVREGRLSCWSATRVLAPLARANSAHAEALLTGLREQPLSTRELRAWFEHYRSAARSTRERMAQHPKLFLQALAAGEEQRALEQLRAGPEGECLGDLHRLHGFIKRVRGRLRALDMQSLTPELLHALRELSAQIEVLGRELREVAEREDARNPQRRTHLECAGTEPATDQPPAAALA